MSRDAPRIAVVFVHGVESAGEDFARTATALLRSEFTRIAGVDADDALVVRPAYWAPVLEERQQELTDRLGGERGRWLFDGLDTLAGWAGRGSSAALLAAAATGLVRALPGLPDFHFPTLRWLLVHYLGDAVAYQAGTVDRENYDGVHAVLADALRSATRDAGDDAPLAVVAHSLGSVVASNFLWDLQAGDGVGGRPAPSTALERGETLAWLYTLGSPLALWAQRFPDFGEPLTVPHPDLHTHHPRVEGEWVNVWSPDDVVSSPLRGLGEHWEAAIAEDRRVAVGPRWLGWSPLSHPYYWNDRRVITPIASSLARGWHRMRTTSRDPDGVVGA